MCNQYEAAKTLNKLSQSNITQKTMICWFTENCLQFVWSVSIQLVISLIGGWFTFQDPNVSHTERPMQCSKLHFWLPTQLTSKQRQWNVKTCSHLQTKTMECKDMLYFAFCLLYNSVIKIPAQLARKASHCHLNKPQREMSLKTVLPVSHLCCPCNTRQYHNKYTLKCVWSMGIWLLDEGGINNFFNIFFFSNK